ncbi:MAG: hypothetical protein L3K06_00160 [Thermoplasmata archaeon]|nr:hypothetical protein [Thermoplasmata archaeon]
MAKKARKRLEEEAASAFEFPEFDELAFIRHEFEQTYAMFYAVIVAVALGFASFGIDRALSGHSQPTLQGLLPPALAIGVIAFSPFLLQRLRASASEYTRGDWAGLIVLEIFLWLGLWFLLADVFHVG